MQKKVLSLLLALTLVLVLAAPATAAYSGSYSNDGTSSEDYYYLFTASCSSTSATASTSYQKRTSTVQSYISVTHSGGVTTHAPTPTTGTSRASLSIESGSISTLYCEFRIDGVTWDSATVCP